MRSEILRYIKAFVLAGCLLTLTATAAAWTVPTATPPSANVDGVLLTDSSVQTKTGSLTVATLTGRTLVVGSNTIGSIVIGGSGGVGSMVGDKITTTNQFCISADCIGSWGDIGVGRPNITVAMTESKKLKYDSVSSGFGLTPSYTTTSTHSFCALSGFGYTTDVVQEHPYCLIEGAPGTTWTVSIPKTKNTLTIDCYMQCYDHVTRF